MTQRKPRGGKRPPPPNHILTIALTEQGVAILQALSQGASDELGRTISGSATIRALLHHAAQQGPAWARSHLVPLIEAELAAGVLWGKKSAS